MTINLPILPTALRDCLSLPTIEAHTFCVQKEEDVLKKCSPLFVHKKHRHCPMKLQQNCAHTETEQYKHSPGVPMALVVSFRRRLQILEVILMLLIIAGDVEINPGPVDKLTPLNIFAELVELTDLIPFGKELGIPQLELDRIQDDDPNYDSGNVVEALRDCLSLPTIEAPTFCVQKQEDVSRKISPLFVPKKHRHCPMNLQQNCAHTETEQYKHSPGVPMALVVSFRRRLQILEVILMLLIIAGDVETNPGPVHKLTLSNLYEELLELTDPFPFGKELGIPQLELDRIQRDHPEDMKEQKMALCQYIVNELIGIDWENIANALRGISMEHLAVKINQNYCQQAGKLMPDRLVKPPAVHGRKPLYPRVRRVRGESKKQQEQETSGASVSVIKGPPGPSPSSTLHRKTGQLMPGRQVELRTVQDGRKPSNSRAKRVNSGETKNKKRQTSSASVPATMDPPRRSSSSTLSLQGRQVQLPAVEDGRKPSHSRAKRVSGESKKRETSGESVPATMDPPRRSSSSTPSLQAGKLMPNPLVELPAVQPGRKHSLSRANTVSDTPKKKQKLETSDASLPAIIDPPTSSPSGTLSPQAGKLMPNPLVELPAVQHGKKHSLSRANTVSDKPKKKQKLETSGASLPASIDPPTSSSSSTGESVTKSACTSISNASIGY